MTVPDLWALWPDDYMVPWNELDAEIRNGRSDDVQKVLVCAYDETSTPSAWTVLGPKSALCPVCQGTRNHPEWAGWQCRNCGGQTMSGKATGIVPLRRDGTPCVHEWHGRPAGNCYRIFTCIHGCGTQWDEDSGD